MYGSCNPATRLRIRQDEAARYNTYGVFRYCGCGLAYAYPLIVQESVFRGNVSDRHWDIPQCGALAGMDEQQHHWIYKAVESTNHITISPLANSVTEPVLWP